MIARRIHLDAARRRHRHLRVGVNPRTFHRMDYEHPSSIIARSVPMVCPCALGRPGRQPRSYRPAVRADTLVGRTYGGTSEVMKDIIARSVLEAL